MPAAPNTERDDVRQALAIWLLCIGAAICYGICHDQVTARVCVEYFTVGHPRLFPTTSPTLLAFGWGVAATWWGGCWVGLPLAAVARLGSRPKITARMLLRPVGVLLAGMALVSLCAGITGYHLAVANPARADLASALEIPVTKYARYQADYWAHSAAYSASLAGGLLLCLWVWLKRTRPATPAAC